MKIKLRWAQRIAMVISICSAASVAAADPVASGLERQAIVVDLGETIGPVSRAADWRAVRKLSLAARSDYSETNGASATVSSIAATAQLRLSSHARPYTAGILFEYGFVQERSDTALLAGVFGYSAGRWSWTFAPFYKKRVGSAGEWKQQSTARYRFRPRHSFGLELIGPLASVEGSRLLFGYYGKLSDSLALSVTAGSAIGAGPDLVARTSIAWHLR